MRIGKGHRKKAYVLVMVLFFGGITLTALSGALQWCSSTSRTTERNNRYFAAVSAAEAATEKVLTAISKDFQALGEGEVYNKLDTYRGYVPTTSESSYWSSYLFSNGQGTQNKTYVTRTVAWSYVQLSSQYEGLNGMASTYKIISNAKTTTLTPAITAAVKQEVQVASIPIFQFAIFYSMDLEINPGPNMNITGRVHGNANIYSQPQATLNYLSHVTAAGSLNIGKSPLDPTTRTPGTVNYYGEHDAGVSSLSLPIGTNNTPAAVRAVVEVPPGGEASTSLMGQQRYYNKADIVILVYNTNVVATSGSWNGFATTIPWNQVDDFLSTNVSFYNKREGKTVKASEINVGNLKTWSETNTTIRSTLGRDVNSIYITDLRTQSGTTQAGIRLKNGQTLPSKGLTIATPLPAYVQGHYNCPTAAHLGTTNTSNTKPASIVADAITILSTAWNDANASSALSSRLAANTTVNAAFLAGIVPSNGTSYSGGVENFPRFLENWSGDTFTYNGSMVVMYPSQVATTPWGGSDVYSPPSRNWAFDLNFMDATKLPPGTPQLLTIIRGKWAMIAPDDVTL